MNFIKLTLKAAFVIIISACNQNKNTPKLDLAAAPEQREFANFTQQKINDNLYVLKANNYNTNVGVFIGNKGILLIDPMFGFNTESHKQLVEAVKTLSNLPITHVLNTHSHTDHSGANAFFAELGATIISQNNAIYTKTFTDQTFKDTYSISMDDETITLYHLPAHTFDDVLIHFAKNNVVFMGDTYMTNSFPHFYYGGGSKGHLNFMEKALKLSNAQTTIVPAHGSLTTTKAALQDYKAHSIDWSHRILELHQKGQTPKEMGNDAQLLTLSDYFNNSKVSSDRLTQTLEKTLSVERISNITLSEPIILNLTGIYKASNGNVFEVAFIENNLYFRSKGNFMYQLLPMSENEFIIKGQVPEKQVTFTDNTSKKLIYNDGKRRTEAHKTN